MIKIKFEDSPKVVDYSDDLPISDEVLIDSGEIVLRFTFPLRREVDLKFKCKAGFSRLTLFKCVNLGYSRIYDKEEEEVGDPGRMTGLRNRKESNGPYGIWGYYLDDLVLDRIVFKEVECLGKSLKKSVKRVIGFVELVV